MKFPFKAWFVVAIMVVFAAIAIVSSCIFIRSVLISDLDLWAKILLLVVWGLLVRWAWFGRRNLD